MSRVEHGKSPAPPPSPYERVVAAGKVRQPRPDRQVDLRDVQRVTLPEPTAAIIADVRGDE